jgi:hypothetical protein
MSQLGQNPNSSGLGLDVLSPAADMTGIDAPERRLVASVALTDMIGFLDELKAPASRRRFFWAVAHAP